MSLLKKFLPTAIAVSASALLCLILSGCYSANDVGRAELQLTMKCSSAKSAGECEDASPEKVCERQGCGFQFSGRRNYAFALAHVYTRLSDQASSSEDIAAAGIIGSAGVGAGSMLYDANLNLLKSAGLAAGLITAGRNYTKPFESAEHLLNAAEAMLCISNVADMVSVELQTDANARLLDSAIDSVRLDLRRKLQRQAPDFTKLRDAFKSLEDLPTDGRMKLQFTQSKENLSADLDICISKAVVKGLGS